MAAHVLTVADIEAFPIELPYKQILVQMLTRLAAAEAAIVALQAA